MNKSTKLTIILIALLLAALLITPPGASTAPASVTETPERLVPPEQITLDVVVYCPVVLVAR